MSRPIENNIPVSSGLSVPLQPGLVQNVCRQWIVHEDTALATRLQNEEFETKYNRNSEERRLARQDVPLARNFENYDRERLKKERHRHLQRNRETTDEDVILAEYLQSEELHKKEQQRTVSELRDEEIAKKLQEKERKRYELRVKEKELRRQRKMLEQELQKESNNLLGSEDDSASHHHDLVQSVARVSLVDAHKNNLILRSDGKMEDAGDFTDFCIQPPDNVPETERITMRNLQDEELARLLQEQEHKRGSQRNRDKLKEIELRDAELARVMQEQEKLRHSRRSHRRRHRDMRQSSDPCHSAEEIHEVPERHSHSLPQPQPPDDSWSREMNNPPRHVLPTRSHVPNALPPFDNNMAKYASRPLPDTPSPESPPHVPRGYNMSLLRALDRNMEQELSGTAASGGGDAAPGITDARSNSSRDSRRMPFVFPEENDDSDTFLDSTVHPSATSNIFTAIDPTYVHKREKSSPFTRNPPSTVHDISPSGATAHSHTGVLGSTEDGYCDLDEIRVFREIKNRDDDDDRDFDLVHGQRRQAFNRDTRRTSSGRKANCKQQ